MGKLVTVAATDPEIGKIPPARELTTVQGFVTCVTGTVPITLEPRVPLTLWLPGRLLTDTAPDTDWFAGGVNMLAILPPIITVATEPWMFAATVPLIDWLAGKIPYTRPRLTL